MESVELHIEQLVLHGFAPHEKGLIVQALEAELVRLLSEYGVPPALISPPEIGQSAKGQGEVGQGQIARRDVERLDGGAYQAVPGARPQESGVQIAQAIYRGLGQ
jgi:hypothetical protein